MDQDELVDAARRLATWLRDDNIPVDVSFLGRRSASEEWQLTMATHLVDRIGPRRVFRKLRGVLVHHKSPLSLDQVSFVSPRDPVIRELGKWVKMTTGTVAWLGPMTLGDESFDQVYVFR